MNKLIIFDLDGTLLHTLPDMTDAINQMLTHFGYASLCERDIRNFIGNGARNLVKKSLIAVGASVTEEELDDRLKFYNEFYTSSNSPKTSLFKDMDKVLVELKKRGYLLAVLTNKPQMTTDNVNEHYLKQFDFSLVVGSGVNVKRKPDPTETLNIINRLGVDKVNTYFVGDGETDVMTSINAGVKNIAVLWGYRDQQCLQDAGATVFAKVPMELLDLIK